MRRLVLVLLALALPLWGKPSPSPSPKPVAAPTALPLSPEHRATLGACQAVPVYVPSYLPSGFSLKEVEGSYSSYTLGYQNAKNCSLWLEGNRRDRPPDLKMGKPAPGEVQLKVKHPVLGVGKLCWLPRENDPHRIREEYSYGVLAGKSNVAYDVGTLGPVAPQEVQKFMQGLVLLKR